MTPRGAVWSGYIDHKRWHALVDIGTSKVVQLFGPHVRKTLKVYYQPGRQELVALVAAPSDEMAKRARRGFAAVAGDKLCDAVDEQSVREALLLELDAIDQRTATQLKAGVQHAGFQHSLSPNALAKLDALVDAESFPVHVSSADNLSSYELAHRDAVVALRDAARARLREVLAEGDRQKAAARSRVTGG